MLVGGNSGWTEEESEGGLGRTLRGLGVLGRAFGTAYLLESRLVVHVDFYMVMGIPLIEDLKVYSP